MDYLEFSDIKSEISGALVPGKLKMTDQNIIFKNGKTGKVEQLSASELDTVLFQNVIGMWCLRIFLKNGTLHRFFGFRGEDDKEKIAKFFSTHYNITTLEKDLSLTGWNWGTAKFNGSVLTFDVKNQTAFEIPLNNVSQCVTGKNEITMEFHHNDEVPVNLIEMRFFIPGSELSGDLDPVDSFHQQVMDKASVISVSGDAIAIFREMQCLTPRGRYDIKIFQTFFQLHGKTFDYKIPMTTVLRLFLLPHKDGRQMYFIVSLDPPIKQGQTRYPFLVLLFTQEEETSLELPFTEEELSEKYDNKLEKELSGPTYEVLGKIMKVIVNRKLTGPGSFVGHGGSPGVSCSYKAAAGYLYPLERGFIYVHKPPVHIRFEEISSVNFARGGGSTRSFDFEIEIKSGNTFTFSNIEKEEYSKLFDFMNAKKIHIKNRSTSDKANYKDDFGDSDTEAAPDAYLARVKAEAELRDEGDDDDDDDSTDDDFKPKSDESDVALEYDSGHTDTDSSDSGPGSGGEHRKDKHKHKKNHKEKHRDNDKEPEKKKVKKSKDKDGEPTKKRKKKDVEKDKNRPKKPMSAFMLYMNAIREDVKRKYPDLKVTEIAKKVGEMWKELTDKTEWDEKAKEAKKEYEIKIKDYEEKKKSGESGSHEKPEKTTSPSSSNLKKVSKDVPGQYKSKEYVSSDSDSDAASNDDDSSSNINEDECLSDSVSDNVDDSVSTASEDSDQMPSKRLKIDHLNSRCLILESSLQRKESLIKAKDEQFKELYGRLRDGEQLDVVLKQKDRQIDELKSKFEMFSEIQENLKKQQQRLDKLPELERELMNTKERYQELQLLISNKLLLEEKVQDLSVRLEMMAKERDDLIKYQTENIGLKSFITDLKKTFAKLYDCEELENMKTSFLVQKIIELTENSKRQEVLLTNEKFQLKAKAENYEKTITELTKDKLALKQELDGEKTITNGLKNQLKLAQRKNLLLKTDRDNYRSLVDSYEKDLTILSSSTNPIMPQKATQEELLSKIGKLEDSQQKYRDLIQQYEQDLNVGSSSVDEQVASLKRDLIAARRENEDLKKAQQDKCGDKKVFRYLENPLMSYNDEEKDALKAEVDKLKQKIFQMQKSNEVSSTSLSESVYIDTDKLAMENEQLKKKCERYYEIYQFSLKEFRLIVVKVFGYQITKLTDFFRLTSCFDKPNEHHINFNFDSNGNLHLLEGEYSPEVRSFLELQLTKPQLLPIFISSLTVKLYRKQNSSTPSAASTSTSSKSSTANIVIDID